MMDRRLRKQLEARGARVTRCRSNHIKVSRPGKATVFLPSTPSDHRSIRNALALLRKHGYLPRSR